MAKVKTLEELQHEEEIARKAYDLAQRRWDRANKALINYAKAKDEAEELTLAKMLQTYLTVPGRDYHVENERGYRALQTYSTEKWGDTGLRFLGSHFPANGQRSLTLTVDYDADDAKLETLAGLLEEVFVDIVPGALANYDYGRSVKATERDGWKAVSVMEHTLSESGVHYLCQKEDGAWVVARIRYSRWEYWNQNSLMDALKYLRKYHPYGVAESSYNDEEEFF